MNAKHTPGPWSYADPHDACCGWACTPDGCHESHPTGIYVVHGPDEADPDVLDCYGLALKSEADARLIAAAPDMLEELRRAEATLRLMPGWEGQADAIARVIAKAGGAS